MATSMSLSSTNMTDNQEGKESNHRNEDKILANFFCEEIGHSIICLLMGSKEIRSKREAR